MEEQNGTGHDSGVLSTKSKRPMAFREPDFVNLEKNLTSLGFFTPSSKKIKVAKAKVVHFTRFVEGEWRRATVTIIPASLFGLPITADQDKYIAFQKLLMDRRENGDEITNPVGFTSAELLRILGKRTDTGKNYQDVSEWLDVMTSTTIKSEGAVYFAERKAYGTDRFHVFERSVSYGLEMEDGTLADKNYVWLSEWQLENINNNYTLPVDFETYKILKNNISKALVPLLQIWLYATAKEGVFEKNYPEFCQQLSIREYAYLSQIRQVLSPAMDELTFHGYLKEWRIEPTSRGDNYKIVFLHGTKFYQDRRKRLGKPEREENGQTLSLELGEVEAQSGQPRRITLQQAPIPLDPLDVLVSQFYQTRYGQPQQPSAKERGQAEELLAMGEDLAHYAVEFAAKQGKAVNGFPNDFGGVAKILAKARAGFEADRRKKAQVNDAQVKANHEQKFKRNYQAYLMQLLEGELEKNYPESYCLFSEDEERTFQFYKKRASKSE